MGNVIQITKEKLVDRYIRFSGVAFFGERNVTLEYDGEFEDNAYLFLYHKRGEIIEAVAASSVFMEGEIHIAGINLFTDPLAVAFADKNVSERIPFSALLVNVGTSSVIGRGRLIIENNGFANGEIPDPVPIPDLYVRRSDLIGVTTINEMLQKMIGGN